MHRANILIVEDEAIVAADLASKLCHLGYEIVGSTPRGEEALSLAHTQRPDLVLMDIHLQGDMDGVDAAERIRLEDDLPVIYLTAHSDSATITRAKFTQPYGYVIKPFEERELETAIEMAIYKHKVERQLRESEERFRLATEALEGMIYDVDLTTSQVQRSVGLVNLQGYLPQEVPADINWWKDQLHPDDRLVPWQKFEQAAIEQLPAFRSEYRVRHKKGHYVWVWDNTRVVYTRTGKPTRLIGCVVSIDERKRAEAEIRQGRERLERMLETSQVAIAFSDCEGQVFAVNDALCRLTGYTHDDFVSNTSIWKQFVTQECQELDRLMLEEFGDLAQPGESRRFGQSVSIGPYERELLRKDGTTVPILISMTALSGERGEHVAFLVDLTERKRAEQELKRLNEELEQRVIERTRELHEREARLGAILETAGDAIITLENHGLITSVNPATEYMFGYKAEEILGQSVNLLMPAPFWTEADGTMSAYLQANNQGKFGVKREVQGRKKNGDLFPLDVVVSEIDRLQCFTAILRDISRRKELEREVLEVATQEQKRIGQELHDSIGQELTGLGLMADALSRHLQDAPPLEKKLVSKLTQGLLRVHEQVRTLCRELFLVDLDSEALHMALEDLVHTIQEQSGVECTFDCPERVPVSDPVTAKHLFRIAQEAVSNALRHGRAQHIWISLRTGPEGLCLSIQDDGVGVQMSSENSRGMGIPTMRYRADMIGATMQIGPVAGRGTMVTCIMPWREGHVQK